MRRILITAAFLALLSPAYAADSTVSAYPGASALDGTELFYGVQGGADRKVTGAQIKTYTGGGTVTSVGSGCGSVASPSPITGSGTIFASEAVNPQTGSNYAIVAGDCGKLVNLSNASSQIPTIAQAGTTGFPAGYYVDVCNQGAGTQTITPATSTIGGASTFVLAAGSAASPKCVRVVSDGTNYQIALGGLGGTGANPSATAGDTAVNGSATTFMRSDAAPAIQKGSSSAFGIVKVDNSTITASGGVISAVGGGGGSGGPATQSVVSNWYLPKGMTVPVAGANGGIGSTRLYPGYVDTTLTTNLLGVRIQTLFSGGLIQAAIYAADATTRKPTGNPICSTASMSTTLVANVNSAATCSLTANTLYWFATNTDNTTSVPVNASVAQLFASSAIGSSTQGNIMLSATATFIGYSTPQTFGTWGDLTSATFTDVTAASIPLVEFRIGSVP